MRDELGGEYTGPTVPRGRLPNFLDAIGRWGYVVDVCKLYTAQVDRIDGTSPTQGDRPDGTRRGQDRRNNGYGPRPLSSFLLEHFAYVCRFKLGYGSMGPGREKVSECSGEVP